MFIVVVFEITLERYRSSECDWSIPAVPNSDASTVHAQIFIHPVMLQVRAASRKVLMPSLSYTELSNDVADEVRQELILNVTVAKKNHLGRGSLFAPEGFEEGHHALPNIAATSLWVSCRDGNAAAATKAGREGREGSCVQRICPFNLWGVDAPWLSPGRRSLSHQTLLVLDLMKSRRAQLMKFTTNKIWGPTACRSWGVVCSGVSLTMQAAWTASDRFPASGSHQNTWHSKRCVPPSTITAKVWLSWPTPRKVRKRTWHSQKGSSPSCQGEVGGTGEEIWTVFDSWVMSKNKMTIMKLPLPSTETECYQWRGQHLAPTHPYRWSSWCSQWLCSELPSLNEERWLKLHFLSVTHILHVPTAC